MVQGSTQFQSPDRILFIIGSRPAAIRGAVQSGTLNMRGVYRRLIFNSA